MKPIRLRAARAESGPDLLEALEPRHLLTADLAGQFMSIASSPLGGTSPNITLRVFNRGNSGVKGQLIVQVYAVGDGQAFDPTTATFVTNVFRNVKLAPGKVTNLRFAAPIDATLPTGGYRFVAVIDPNDAYPELSDANNYVTSNAFVVRQPQRDLIPSFRAGTALPRVIQGRKLDTTMKVNILNPSSSNATFPANTRVSVQVVARPVGATGTSGDILLNRTNVSSNVGGLKPGRIRQVTVPIRFPATFPAGQYHIVAIIDTANVAAEVNENNNETYLGGFAVLTVWVVNPPTTPFQPPPGRVGVIGGNGQLSLSSAVATTSLWTVGQTTTNLVLIPPLMQLGSTSAVLQVANGGVIPTLSGLLNIGSLSSPISNTLVLNSTFL